MHKDNFKFHNFSQNAANFPNSMGPGPIPKKGVRALVSTQTPLILVGRYLPNFIKVTISGILSVCSTSMFYALPVNNFDLIILKMLRNL